MPMDLNLSNKVAVITGGAKGIGLEITKALFNEGCKVCMVGTDESALQRGEELFNAPDRCMSYRCDVTKMYQIVKMFHEVQQKFGGVDILVNNAGVLKPKPIEELSEADWDEGININLKSVFLCTQQVISLMRKRGGGVIINASSFAAQIPSVGQSAYAAAKIGVKAFTQVSAAELAPYGIRVLAYIPGVINTHLIQPLISDSARAERMKHDIALHRFGEPSEIGSVVAFMASEAAGYVSGCSVEIHGGKFCVQNPGAAYTVKG